MSDLKLTDREWKGFFIGGKEGIFQIKATKSGIDKNKLKVSENGKTPYITRSDMDNGINLFVSDEQMPKYKKDDGNVITIGLDTQTVFYQKNSFWTGQNIQVLSNDNLNYWVAMFIIPLLKIQMKKFAWGSTGATLGRLNRTRIMLPVNSDGLPDWRFMEDFMKQIEQDKIAAVLSYYNNSLNNNSLRGGVERWMPSKNRWAAFAIQDICEIHSGVRLTKQDMQEGKIPFVGASDSNNGITAFIANRNASLDKDVLGVNYNGSVVENFYHPYECLFSDDVKRLKIKSKQAGKYAYLFLKTMILKQKSKYQYGYKFNTTRMTKQKILLLVDTDGRPDWQEIERFMRKLELRKIIDYLNYLEKGNKRLS
jgi:restriction enzyme bgcI subunit beta